MINVCYQISRAVITQLHTNAQQLNVANRTVFTNRLLPLVYILSKSNFCLCMDKKNFRGRGQSDPLPPSHPPFPPRFFYFKFVWPIFNP